MKAIAVGSPERLPDFPNLPAAAEVLPGFNALAARRAASAKRASTRLPIATPLPAGAFVI